MFSFVCVPALLFGEKNDVENPNQTVGLVDVRVRQVGDDTLSSMINEPATYGRAMRNQ
jgi:hypothetical protein